MDTLLHDLLYSLRTLRKNPGFTCVAIITLALGIGANTAIFSVADAFLIRPVTFPDTDRMVMIMALSPGQTSDWSKVAPGDFEDWERQGQSFEPLAAGRWNVFNLTGAGDPLRVRGFEVTANFLETLRVEPALGRGFLKGANKPGYDTEVVLGDGLWQRQFGADPHIIGKSIRLNDKLMTVVGVMPKSFSFPLSAELWTPLALAPEEQSSRTTHSLFVVSRRRPGVSLRQAQAEMNAISTRLENAYPNTNQGWRVHVVPIAEFVTGDLIRSYTLLLLGAVAFVLLIACANVANLQFARGSIRNREVAVRLSLGATRFRVARQSLMESMLLGLGGAAIGLPLAALGLKLILVNMPPDVASYLPGWSTIAIDWRALFFTLGVSVLAGIASGMAPALQNARVNLNDALKLGGRSGSAGRGRHPLRSSFVVLQITLSLVLLVGAGLMVKGMRTLVSLTDNFSPSTVLALRLNLPETRYKDARQMTLFYDRMLEKVSSTPGVRSAAIATQLPFADGGDVNTSPFSIEGRPVSSPRERRIAVVQYVSPSYFALLNIALRQGRLITSDDAISTLPVAVINQRLAKKYWPAQSAIGQRVRVGTDEAAGTWMTIVGVVADVRNSWISAQPEPGIYVPYRQAPPHFVALALRTQGAPLSVLSSVRNRIAELDAELPLYKIMPYDEMIHQSVLGPRYVAVLLSVLGVIALALAAVGLYGVMSYLVTSRTREIGIRMALGARRGVVLGMTFRWGASLLLFGGAIGMLAAIAFARLFASILYGVRAGDLETFFIASVTLAAAASLAAFIPARRAAKVDPMVALRYE
jgi:putative ABC transport system permease protein